MSNVENPALAGKVYLKIKIKHLALEPALIRLEARKRRAAYKGWRHRQELRQRELDAYVDPWLAIALNGHRTAVVRPEARAAFLAYAFIRGKTYDSIEPTSKYMPPLKRIAELASKYGMYSDKKDAETALIGWITASGRWEWHKFTQRGGESGYFRRNPVNVLTEIEQKLKIA